MSPSASSRKLCLWILVALAPGMTGNASIGNTRCGTLHFASPGMTDHGLLIERRTQLENHEGNGLESTAARIATRHGILDHALFAPRAEINRA